MEDIKTSIDVLKDDCLQHIFSFLPPEDLLNVEEVSRRWKDNALLSWSPRKILKIDQRVRDQRLLDKRLKRYSKYITTLRIDNHRSMNLEATLEVISGRCPNLRSVELDDTRLKVESLIKILGNYRDQPEDMTQYFNENNVLSIAQEVANLKLPKLIQVIAFRAMELRKMGSLEPQTIVDFMNANLGVDIVFEKTAFTVVFGFPDHLPKNPILRRLINSSTSFR